MERIPVALITGAASGIGLALAKQFAEHGENLALVDIDAERLGRVVDGLAAKHAVKVRGFVRDLTHPQAPPELWAEVAAADCRVTTLVNNAGFGVLGPFHENGLERYTKMIALHVQAPTHLCKLFIDEALAEKRGGRILNVASIGGFMPCPLFSIYHATKAYTLFFSEALANELAPKGIVVSALCPGAVRTGFQKTAQNEHVKAAQGRLMEADDVARIGYREFLQGKTVIVPGWKNKAIVNAVRLLPRAFVAGVMRSYYEPA